MIASRLVVAVALLVSWQAAAAGGVAPAEPQFAGKAETGSPSRSGSAALYGKAVSRALLGTQRGGTEPVAGITLSGSIANTTATNVATGANAISDSAFAGSTGLPTVIQNSGNNVLIQTSTIINITVK